MNFKSTKYCKYLAPIEDDTQVRIAEKHFKFVGLISLFLVFIYTVGDRDLSSWTFR